jgi:hypothetical protein
MRRLLERFALSFALGLLAPFVFIIGAEPFAVGGRTSVGEVAAGCLGGTLYLAGCQFWVARKENRGLVANWPTVIGMATPQLGVLILMQHVEKRGTVISQGLPMLIAGCVGILAGTVLAARRTKQTNTQSGGAL